ncbi:methyltransferase [Spiroplasma helicoides]|uniref:Methyltransferase n=1 Tax=Spiroplasma helicoides TaxID=216938 RepID=A0A1B3SJ60_9MOLU|nr:methyltransferase [Spiroplasma helicoides]AOG59966.1 methyltransferase [Spiroplasma helicoides]
MKVINKVLNYKNLNIYQETEMFYFCLDSVLLARFYKPKAKEKVICDFGTNNAIIPLILSKFISKDTKIIGIDIQPKACELAKENIKLNNLENIIEIINQDIKEYVKDKNNFFDVIYCNPPFFKVFENSNLNTKSEKLIPARHEVSINLEEVVRSAKIALKNGGRFVMIHLVERLDEIIEVLRKNNFKVKNIRIIYSKKNQSAKKVLIDAINDGNEGLNFMEPLFVHNDDGSYTEEVSRMFGD